MILFVLAAFRRTLTCWMFLAPLRFNQQSICYAAFLDVKINYTNYLIQQTLFLTVAGRYIFPVMGAVYAIFPSLFLVIVERFKGRLTLAVFAVLVLIYSDFPFFLSDVTPRWYDWTSK